MFSMIVEIASMWTTMCVTTRSEKMIGYRFLMGRRGSMSEL